ncbi:hypothetical protein QZH41_015205 [Actinostola sp. cb2023]|nr:hypothetical protein QZH41_015205 [Actinostola sp. cb2023]
MSAHYVQLCGNPLRFVAVSKDNSVFFDEANKQVFAVNRLNSLTHVVVKGPDSRTKIMFEVPDAGHVHSIKFSYDHKILAIQRSPKTVDFINFADGIDSQQYHQSCKGKSAHVIGFSWTNLNEIVFITNQGLEFYQVMPEKHSLKMIKNYNVQVNWFVFLPESAMLLLSSSGHGNIIHPYHFRAGSVMRLPKFEVDLTLASKAQKVSLLERDVTLANMSIASHHTSILGKLGKSWENLGKLGKTWENLGKLGKTWENLGNLGKTWENLGKPGKTWENLGKPGKTWENLGKPGKTWENLGKPGKTWENLGKPGKTWENLGKPGKTREILENLGKAWESSLFHYFPHLLILQTSFEFSYSQLYVVILRNQSRGLGGLTGAEIVLYQLQRDSPAKKTAVLQLNMNGRFAVNVVDNLVIVHHQASRTSMLFDIKLGGEFDGQVTFYQPVLAPLPIEQTVLDSDSQNWIVFQPNIIIDARLGCLWEVMLKLEPLVTMIQDKGLLIDFLLLRRDSNMVILAVFKQALIPGRQCNLTVIASMLDKVNKIYRAALDTENAAIQVRTQQNPAISISWGFELIARSRSRDCTILFNISTSSPGLFLHPSKSDGDVAWGRGCGYLAGSSRYLRSRYSGVLQYFLTIFVFKGSEVGRQTPTKAHVSSPQTVVNQHDMYTHVLSMFVDNKDIKYKFMVAVLVEYIRSLNQFDIHPEHYLYELIINLLVENKCYYQLHQLLQYHVISDSKPLACLMLSLESTYPPAYQLALDMLKRLSTASEEIVEVLLSKHQLLPALRYIRAIGAEDSASPRKFLETAVATKESMLFYTATTVEKIELPLSRRTKTLIRRKLSAVT